MMGQPDPALPGFDEPLLALAIEQLSEQQINTLPYGAVRLDEAGRAVFYSDVERRQSGFRKQVVGQDFFREIAPCMNNPNFRGRIDRALAAGRLDISFTFMADLPSGVTDLDVRVQSATGGGCWVFMRREG